MMNKITGLTFTFLLLFSIFFSAELFAQIQNQEQNIDTDNPRRTLFGYFDLRERETFIQVTNVESVARVYHVQIFNVGQDCNENNFFDDFTPNDTHIYNMRDILTNDGDLSGVVLPEDAYGIVVISAVVSEGGNYQAGARIMGNLRILDDTGYEYRTNLVTIRGNAENPSISDATITFNYNMEAGVNLSDIVGITVANVITGGEAMVDPVDDYWLADVDIYNNNEVPFSCRNVIFACMDQDNPRLEELLSEVGDASVASYEYGINEVIPHSRGSELLCPNNIVGEGFVNLNFLDESLQRFIMYIGLNNGNGRGTMDSYWLENVTIPST